VESGQHVIKPQLIFPVLFNLNRYQTTSKSFTLSKTYFIEMKFAGTAAFALTVAVAMAGKLSDSPALDDAKSQCTTGDISCCNSAEETSSDGILGGLLAGGLLNGLLGNSNSACAKTSLIDELDILGKQPIKV
jgi:hypothetical protein